MTKPILTQSELKEKLHYDSETGIFTWKIKSRGIRVSKLAGYINKAGYVIIRINDINRLSHRLAWLYVYGYMPCCDIDHMDMNKSNNRLSNLRLANDSQNHWNIGLNKNNKTGYKGVSYNKLAKKYRAHIRVNNTRTYLGQFETAELAFAAYSEFAKQHHKEFYREQ